MSREDDAREYRRLHPDVEARTVVATGRRPGLLARFWRCRPVKGHGPWLALPEYTKEQGADQHGEAERSCGSGPHHCRSSR